MPSVCKANKIKQNVKILKFFKKFPLNSMVLNLKNKD